MLAGILSVWTVFALRLAVLSGCMVLWMMTPSMVQLGQPAVSTDNPNQLFGSPEVISQRRLGSFDQQGAVQRAKAGAARHRQLKQQHPTLHAHRVEPVVVPGTAARPIPHSAPIQSQAPPTHQHSQASVQDAFGPVDIVFLWVNGSDPHLHQEVQEFERNAASAAMIQHSSSPSGLPDVLDNPVRQARFNAERDELKFSLRSLERYLKWYRHLYIVTNGQVPSWLDIHNPRVTVVPHTSIFKQPEDLPTFNSNAIHANLANIPGLSETYIVFDDDLFLTASWAIRDFVGPDGGHVLTGSTPAQDFHGPNLHLRMTSHTAKLFNDRFGPWPRYVPTHSPKLFQKRWLSELQRKIPEAFKQTSASHARTPTDIVVATAYQFYVAQFQPGNHSGAPDAHAAFMSIDDQTVQPLLTAALLDLEEKVAAGDRDAVAAKARLQTNDLHHSRMTAAAFALSQVAVGLTGPHLGRRMHTQLQDMIDVWAQPGCKVVCLNDDLPDYLMFARWLIDPVIRGFLEARYREPSQYELPYGVSNGCSVRLPTTAFGQLPTAADYAAACDGAAATLRSGQTQPMAPSHAPSNTTAVESLHAAPKAAFLRIVVA